MIEIIISGVVLVVTFALSRAIKQYQRIKAKNKEIEALKKSLKQYTDSYQFEDCDKPVIDSCRDYIAKRFPVGIEREFEKCDTMEKKKQLAITVTQELAKRMGVNTVDDISFDDLGIYSGFAENNPENGKSRIELHEALLVADPQQLVQTICHELRHCMQHQAIANDIWGYSPQRVALWMYTLKSENYVFPDDVTKFEAYKSQSAEYDARMFAGAIIG